MHFKCLNYIHMQNKTSAALYVQAKFHHFAMCIEKKKKSALGPKFCREKQLAKRSQFWSHLKQQRNVVNYYTDLVCNTIQTQFITKCKKGSFNSCERREKNEKSHKAHNGDGHKSKTTEDKKNSNGPPTQCDDYLVKYVLKKKKKFSGVSSLCKSLNIKWPFTEFIFSHLWNFDRFFCSQLTKICSANQLFAHTKTPFRQIEKCEMKSHCTPYTLINSNWSLI